MGEAEIQKLVAITEKAAEALRTYLAKQGKEGAALRIFITAGGCSGLTYGMVIDDKVSEDDYLIEEHGVKVVVDRSSAPFIVGSTIDYRSDKLLGGGFVINNPNAVSTCGCGESFRTA